MAEKIFIKNVINQIQLAGNGFPVEFSISYRKQDGSYGEKERCRRRAYERDPTKEKRNKELAVIEKENRVAGTFKLQHWDGQKWKEFDVLIPLVVTFNGKVIDHKY